MNKKAIVVGCGLSGSVIARELAEKGFKVRILEKRNHIGGNMYDYIDEYGILVHKYGPHTFHTKKKELFNYIAKYGNWIDYKLTCGAVINNKCTPAPFNFQTIDDFFSIEEADMIKKALIEEYSPRNTVTVLEALRSKNDLVRRYAEFLFENDYKPYSAKQWGLDPMMIDPSILKRVPLKLNYDNKYFDDEYQVMPKDSYTSFFENLLNHSNIEIELNCDALTRIEIKGNSVFYNNEEIDFPLIFTGPIDALFRHRFGKLPYRGLHFVFVHEDLDSKQNMPVVAYPQEPDFVRIIEFKKLPPQDVKGTTYEKEYSIPCCSGDNDEPYYPLLTKESQCIFQKYKEEAQKCPNLYVCGRLGDYRYCNMDEALDAALVVSNMIIRDFK